MELIWVGAARLVTLTWRHSTQHTVGQFLTLDYGDLSDQFLTCKESLWRKGGGRKRLLKEHLVQYLPYMEEDMGPERGAPRIKEVAGGQAVQSWIACLWIAQAGMLPLAQH